MDESWRDRLSIAIKRAKIEKGLNQNDLAARVGVNQATISYWQRGGRTPTLSRINKLCDILEITSLWLLHGEDVVKLDKSTKEALDRLATVTNQINKNPANTTPIEATPKIKATSKNHINDDEMELIKSLRTNPKLRKTLRKIVKSNSNDSGDDDKSNIAS